jgi:hypothetical protein
MEGYDYDAADVLTQFLARHFPERTDRESGVIRDWLTLHVHEYDRVSFSVRVGEGQTPGADLPAGVARSVAYSSKKRIDVLAWQGNTPTIVEVKERITPAVLGQLLTYRQLLLEEQPNVDAPRLVAIGRYSDPDTLRTLSAQGIDVFTYELADSG